MNCNLEIHDELKNMFEITCPFCDKQLKDYMSVEKDKSCCEKMKLENINGEYACVNCGLVDRYMLVNESIYLSFHTSIFYIFLYLTYKILWRAILVVIIKSTYKSYLSSL